MVLVAAAAVVVHWYVVTFGAVLVVQLVVIIYEIVHRADDILLNLQHLVLYAILQALPVFED